MLIKDEVVFTLKGLPRHYVLETNSIANVGFEYGEALVLEADRPRTLVPEPNTIVPVSMGLAGMLLLVRG